jgi:NAD(P)H-flavin reductase/ferredoxin
MSDHCTLIVNGRPLRANIGDTLVDVGLASKMLIPHDCCSGQCDTCKVRVVSGSVDDQGTLDGTTVLACQATIEGDAEILFEEVPIPAKRAGTVKAMRPLSPEIVEVVVGMSSPFPYFPGQYMKVAFAGYPSRDYSPTAYLDGELDETKLVFHIKRFENGLVSTALGHAIGIGHKATINGPYGHAFYRPGPTRLVLVASGTGWAPIWSVARAARLAEPDREMIVIAAARDPRNLYMGPALNWLQARSVEDIVLTATGERAGGDIRFGRPTEFLPTITASDLVYAAGAPEMVDAIKHIATLCGAECHADPFTVSPNAGSMFDRIRRAIRAPSLPVAANPLSPRPGGVPAIPIPLPAAAARHAATLERSAPGETRRRATLFSRLLARS